MTTKPSEASRADAKDAGSEDEGAASPFVAVTKEYDKPPSFDAVEGEIERPPAGHLPTHFLGTGPTPEPSPVTSQPSPSPASALEPPRDETPYMPVTRFRGGSDSSSGGSASGAVSMSRALLESVVARPDDPLSGTPYRTVRRVGAGGMGEVFEADDLETRERVVVKLLHADCTSDSYLDRMRLEAESLALLDHPNIVQVSRFSKTPDGRPYVAMERLEGGTLLHEVRARGALPCEEAVDCGVQILAGLSAAHNRGIVHRDIKPQNIFLCPPDANGKRIIKILDFGLAKTLEDVETSRRPAPLAYPTDVGTFVGTARYATPEQIRGQEVDARTDLYSTALVILTLLTGHQPYGDVQDQREILMAQLNRSPLQGESTLDSLPRPLIAVLEKALSKDIDQRFLTAIGLSDALRNSLTDDAVAISKSAAAVPDGAEPNGESAPVDEADAPPAGALMSIKLAAIVIASAIAFGLLTVVVLYWVGR